MRRVSIVIAVLAAGLTMVGCSDDAPQGIIRLVVEENRDGSTHEMWVGDELLPQLPAPAEGEPEWVLTGAPDDTVLAGGSFYTFNPSRPRLDRTAYVEFDFIAVGEGETSFTLTRGPADAPIDSFTMTVVVNDRDLTEAP